VEILFGLRAKTSFSSQNKKERARRIRANQQTGEQRGEKIVRLNWEKRGCCLKALGEVIWTRSKEDRRKRGRSLCQGVLSLDVSAGAETQYGEGEASMLK